MSGAREYDREALQPEIIERLSAGETMAHICRDDHMPSRRTVTYWREDDPDFDAAYTAAMIEGCHQLIDSTLEIADDLTEDAQSRKLRIWARHELAKRKAPQVFGDKVTQELTGPGGGPVQTVTRIERRIVKAE